MIGNAGPGRVFLQVGATASSSCLLVMIVVEASQRRLAVAVVVLGIVTRAHRPPDLIQGAVERAKGRLVRLGLPVVVVFQLGYDVGIGSITEG